MPLQDDVDDPREAALPCDFKLENDLCCLAHNSSLVWGPPAEEGGVPLQIKSTQGVAARAGVRTILGLHKVVSGPGLSECQLLLRLGLPEDLHGPSELMDGQGSCYGYLAASNCSEFDYLNLHLVSNP